ncbi:dihydrolipoamide acetyltransferase family protein [Niallia sp. RD1]|uniref:dihydrolipoamide acetyltransferase family protein n=1 Tax=Niallia sp. RD1 TaxID=2962858 RepID=UPI0020C18D46|nr:dihydrolipoamide acetyltransferase family protein [Niallia sp. RD1]UTI41920.1 2-oxo acid dehydrogenase subunit E2 [Niallia sp. RD1]
MSTAIVMPKLGMTMKEGTIVEWLKQPGESVSEGEGVAVISTEKLTSEVEAPTDGVLLTIIEEVDNEVEVGKPIGIIGNEKEAESESSQDVREGKDAALEENAPARQEAEVKGKDTNKRIRISPAARKLAQQLRVDTQNVKGTGPNNRITRRDIQAFADKRGEEKVPTKPKVEQETKTIVQPDVQTTGVKSEKLSVMRQTIAKRMQQSLSTTAQLTLHRKAEINALLDFQKDIKKQVTESELDVRLTLTVLIARAVTLSLRDKSFMNTHLIDGQLYLFDEVHLGIATSLDAGLVVPVVKNAERLPLGELAKAISSVTEKARNGQLPGYELTGSTFTISNLGQQGIEYFTPVLNTPETGILGVGTFIEELTLENETVKTVKKLPLSLTFDHQVLDGAPAGDFLNRVVYYLEHPYLLVL